MRVTATFFEVFVKISRIFEPITEKQKGEPPLVLLEKLEK